MKQARHSWLIAGIGAALLAAGCSVLFRYGFPAVSSGFAVIICAVAAAAAGALLFPVPEEQEASAT